MDEQENPLERDHCLSVVLPGGLEKNATVHGSKPVMDLLVTLCARYHLNPSDYTVEVLSPNKNIIGFKPNSPIGSLEAQKILLKPKGAEEKVRRPYKPEATVRLLINYGRSHKAVVRVNPRAPLETLLPVVCDKCELQVQTTVLLRDRQSHEPLDVTKSLDDHGLREVFAKDTDAPEPSGQEPEKAAGTPPPPQGPVADPPCVKKNKKQRDDVGFLSLFRRRKKKPGVTEGVSSAPSSPAHGRQTSAGSNHPPADLHKKRRAPLPPVGASQSIPTHLSACHLGGAQTPSEFTLRRTKRRAPAPPISHQELHADAAATGAVDSHDPTEERSESDASSSSSSRPSLARLHDVPDPPAFQVKDFADARSALAKILTSSMSKGNLRRLKNFPKLQSLSTSASVQTSPDTVDVPAVNVDAAPRSDLPSEPEGEDGAQETGLTASKVVPSKETSPETPRKQTEAEVEPPPPDTSELPTASEPDWGGEDGSGSLHAEDRVEMEDQPEAAAESEGRDERLQSPGTLSTGRWADRDGEEGAPRGDAFPAPPPPVFFSEAVGPAAPAGPPADHHGEPEPATPAAPAPSRFAQAVALAVQRSRLQSNGKGPGPEVPGGPNGGLPSAPRSTYQYGA